VPLPLVLPGGGIGKGIGTGWVSSGATDGGGMIGFSIGAD
jgi:hypothetical protein